ncbi:MAG: PIN domain-containing protein [Moorellales bacterium]
MANQRTNRNIVLDSSVLLHGIAFPNTDAGYLLQKCCEGQFEVVLCSEIIAEAERVLAQKNPRLISRLQEVLRRINPRMEVLQAPYLTRGRELAAHSEDAYAAGLALQSNATVCSLDDDFFQGDVKAGSIRAVRPCDLIWDLSVRYTLSPVKGTIVILFSPRWSSDLDLASKRFYILDFRDIFGFYYEFPKRRFTLEGYVLPGYPAITIRSPVVEGSWYFAVVRYAMSRGFRVLLDTGVREYDRSIRQAWPVFVRQSVLYVGSDANGSNQINGLVRFYIHPEWLPDSDVETLRRERTLSLSMRHLELSSSPFGGVDTQDGPMT